MSEQSVSWAWRRRSAHEAPGRRRAAEAVDLLLVLAADVLAQRYHKKFPCSSNGYAAGHYGPPPVLDPSGPARITHRIGVCFRPSGRAPAPKVPHRLGRYSGRRQRPLFAAQVAESPRSFADRTSISGRDRLFSCAA